MMCSKPGDKALVCGNSDRCLFERTAFPFLTKKCPILPYEVLQEGVGLALVAVIARQAKVKVPVGMLTMKGMLKAA